MKHSAAAFGAEEIKDRTEQEHGQPFLVEEQGHQQQVQQQEQEQEQEQARAPSAADGAAAGCGR